MAVPGADWRKSIDDRRIYRVVTAHDGRRSGGMSATFGSDGQTWSKATERTGTDASGDTGKLEVQTMSGSAETGDRFVLEPPAIEVVGEPTVVAGRSDRNPDGDSGSETVVGERDIYLRYLGPCPRTPGATVVGE